MSKGNDVTETIVRELKLHGITPTLMNGGKHNKILWEAEGNKRVYVAPITPSDFRARLNARAEVRRMLREDGVSAVVETKPTVLERAMTVQAQPDPLGVRVAQLEAEVNALTEIVLEQLAMTPPQPVIEVSVQGATLKVVEPLAKAENAQPEPVRTFAHVNNWEPVKGPLPTPAPAGKKGAVMDAILKAMSFDRVHRASELVREVGRPSGHISSTLMYLEKKGLVEKLGRGEWRKLPRP